MERYFKPMRKVEILNPNPQLELSEESNLIRQPLLEPIQPIKVQTTLDGDFAFDIEEIPASLKPDVPMSCYKSWRTSSSGVLSTLYHRQIGFARSRQRNVPRKFSSQVSEVLSRRLFIEPIAKCANVVGNSVASFHPQGSLLVVGDSRPSLRFLTFNGTSLLDSSSVYHLDSLGTDSVSALVWDPRFRDVLAVTLHFDPTIQILKIQQDVDQTVSVQLVKRFQSNHSHGHNSLLFSPQNDASVIAGGLRGHIRCWRDQYPIKPSWSWKRSESSVVALTWVTQHDVREAQKNKGTTPKVEVTNSSRGRIGLKRRRPLNDSTTPENPPSSQKLLIVSKQSVPQTPLPARLDRRVLVAAFEDGTIVILDVNDVKVRCFGSSSSPSLLATFQARELFQPLVGSPSLLRAPIHRLCSRHSQSHLTISLANGCSATFHLCSDSTSLRAINQRQLQQLDSASSLVVSGGLIQCASMSGVCATLTADVFSSNDGLSLRLDPQRRSQSPAPRHLPVSDDSVSSRLTFEAHPFLPFAVIFANGTGNSLRVPE